MEIENKELLDPSFREIEVNRSAYYSQILTNDIIARNAKAIETGSESIALVDSYKRFELCNYLNSSDCMQYYDLWSKFYDLDAKKTGYNGPACTIKHVPRYFPNLDTKLLDVCAGTGACSYELKKFGFVNVDALDGCQKMLDLAKSRNRYKSYFLNYIEPGKQTSLVADSYDGVICAGGFVNGHLKPEACQEFVRVLRPGGFCVIGLREAFLRTVNEYKNRLEPFMDQMPEWTLVEKIRELNWFNSLEGTIFVFKKII